MHTNLDYAKVIQSKVWKSLIGIKSCFFQLQCLTNPDSAFIKDTGPDCLFGDLTEQDELASYNLVNAYMSFVTTGYENISSLVFKSLNLKTELQET